MANSITAITKYIPYLDEVYKVSSRSSVLDTPAEMVRETMDAKTVMVAKTSMSGLGNYDKNSGYIDGDVTLTWESHTFAYDRGRSFSIDAMDDLETLGMAFGRLSSEFLRTKVAPEIDAIRFSNYASGSGYTVTGETLTADTAVSAIDTGMVAMKENEVDLSGAYLFVTPTVYGFIKDSGKWTRPFMPGENPNRNFGTYDEMTVVEVSQTRFYKGVTLYDGTTTDQEAGGYVRTATTGKNINFLIVARGAVMQITKHAKMRVFDPDVNQKANAYKVDYRLYHDAWVLENKENGIYAHCKA